MGGQTGVFAREDPALVGHELAEQVGVFEIEGIDGEVDFGFGTGRADFGVGTPAAAAFVGLIWAGFARHRGSYLTSRWSVWRRSAGLYFFSSSFSGLSFLLRVVV
jgi:kynureninase